MLWQLKGIWKVRRNKELDWIYKSETLSPQEKQWYLEHYERLIENQGRKELVSNTGEEYEEDGEWD